MTIDMTDSDTKHLTAHGVDVQGQPSTDTYTWQCAPQDLLAFADGANYTTGPACDLHALRAGNDGSVTLNASGGATVTYDVHVSAGNAVVLSIIVS